MVEENHTMAVTTPQHAPPTDDEVDFVAQEMNHGAIDPDGDHSHRVGWEILQEKARQFIVGARAYAMLMERGHGAVEHTESQPELPAPVSIGVEATPETAADQLPPPEQPPQASDPAPDSYEAYLRQQNVEPVA
jgi:hypothetical protein